MFNPLGQLGDLKKMRDQAMTIQKELQAEVIEFEKNGVKIDTDLLKVMSQDLTKKISALETKIHTIAGITFNIASPLQLKEVLFDTLNISTEGLHKTKTGISSAAAELDKLKDKHPIIPHIIEYRELTKLLSTYVDALPQLVSKIDGRVHTSFNQTITATGRLSSSDPNFQNIPIRTELGQKIRKAFVAEIGNIIIAADYSQIELRVIASLANDTKMIEAFQNGLDIHKMTAAEIYNVSLAKVTPELRRAAKTLNFGVLYGMGSQALSEATGMSRDDAKKFIDEYFKKFSGIANYIIETKQLAEEKGYVETIFGRRRYIPEILSPNWQMKREAERMAVNMPVQGTATGDIIKMAMRKTVSIGNYLKVG